MHVWLFDLAADALSLDRLRGVLSADERARAERFVFPHLRVSFAIAHGVLRILLSKYLEVAPERIGFSFNAQGKPSISNEDCRLRFNLSHSGSLGACAMALDCDLGVDVEQIRPMTDMFDIARRFFSPAEGADLEAVRLDQREIAFFNCWTRKEAYIKAIGGGLSIPLDSFQVSLLPDEPARLLSNREGDPDSWNIHAFDAGAGYRGAVAYNGARRELIVRRIDANEATKNWEVSEKLRDVSR
ncbi:MAG: 4'-phosphopantetheinyl transferase superfamily protein [Acidobacteriaceae bacterium]|nr:4'-phosphopantetheinyl transferase superfamily protein [Acidobacteriaceae bacterium]